VHRLKKRPELNDRRAIVLQEVDDGSRWLVKLLAYNTPIAVKPLNLKLPPQPVYESHPDSMNMYMWQTKHMMDRTKWMEFTTGEKKSCQGQGCHIRERSAGGAGVEACRVVGLSQ